MNEQVIPDERIVVNEQIQKLHDQAAELTNAEQQEWNKNWVPGTRNFQYEVALYKKFAELIVKECAKIADDCDELKCEWIGGNILTYFGVKE
jgi:hypothetical protein